MQLGLSSFTYGWAVTPPADAGHLPLDEHGLLDRCRELGVSLLQIGDNLPLHTFAPERLDRLASRAAHEGVRLEVGTRRLTVERIAVYAGIARRLGSRLIRVVIDDADFHPSASEVAATLRAVEPLLEGLVLGIENHDRFPARILRRLIEGTGSARFGICLDTANSLGAGEGLETVLNELGPLTVNLHVKDFAVRRVPCLMGFNVVGRPAGSGQLDVPALLAALRRFGRCDTAVLEQWTPPEDEFVDTLAKEAAWAEQSVAFLRPLFPGSGSAKKET